MSLLRVCLVVFSEGETIRPLPSEEAGGGSRRFDASQVPLIWSEGPFIGPSFFGAGFPDSFPLGTKPSGTAKKEVMSQSSEKPPYKPHGQNDPRLTYGFPLRPKPDAHFTRAKESFPLKPPQRDPKGVPLKTTPTQCC